MKIILSLRSAPLAAAVLLTFAHPARVHAAGVAAGAQPPPSGTGAPGKAAATPKPAPLAEPEKHFVKDAAESQVLEQKLMAIAKRSLNPGEAMKTLQPKMDADLTKVWEEFATISMAKNAKIPLDVGANDKMMLDKIAKLAGDKLDKEILKESGKEAKKLARTFESAAKTLRDAELKAFAEKWLPTVQSHVQEIQQAEDSMKKTK